MHTLPGEGTGSTDSHCRDTNTHPHDVLYGTISIYLERHESIDMECQRYSSPYDFYRRTEGFLLTREAEHNLMLSTCLRLMEASHPCPTPPYLAVAEDRDTIAVSALMIPPNPLLLSHIASAEALSPIAMDVHAAHRTLPGVVCPVPFARNFMRIWEEMTGQISHLRLTLRGFRLDRVTPPKGVSGRFRRATYEHRELLIRWVIAFNGEALGHADPEKEKAGRKVDHLLRDKIESLYLWCNPAPVSMACCVGPTPNGIRISSVYTPPECRRRGYASACVAALST